MTESDNNYGKEVRGSGDGDGPHQERTILCLWFVLFVVDIEKTSRDDSVLPHEFGHVQ